MLLKHAGWVQWSSCRKSAVDAGIVLLMAMGMVAAAAGQEERKFTMPAPEIILVPREPDVLVAPEVISVTTICGSEINIIYEQRAKFAYATWSDRTNGIRYALVGDSGLETLKQLL